MLIPKNKGNDIYQTPIEYANMIVKHFNPKGKILEPCKGEGNFLKVLPKNTEWCEILEGKDFFDYIGKVDWIITNPPYSILRKFMQKSMEVSENIVFFTSINHLWLKARLRDIEEAGFGIKEIMLCDTPKNFPPSGFQFGCFHLCKNYKGDIKFSK
jgi:adenine-specific DNA methylase